MPRLGLLSALTGAEPNHFSVSQPSLSSFLPDCSTSTLASHVHRGTGRQTAFDGYISEELAKNLIGEWSTRPVPKARPPGARELPPKDPEVALMEREHDEQDERGAWEPDNYEQFRTLTITKDPEGINKILVDGKAASAEVQGDVSKIWKLNFTPGKALEGDGIKPVELKFDSTPGFKNVQKETEKARLAWEAEEKDREDMQTEHKANEDAKKSESQKKKEAKDDTDALADAD